MPSIVIYTMLLRVYNVVLEHYKLARITRENLATGLKGVTTFYVYVKFKCRVLLSNYTYDTS